MSMVLRCHLSMELSLKGAKRWYAASSLCHCCPAQQAHNFSIAAISHSVIGTGAQRPERQRRSNPCMTLPAYTQSNNWGALNRQVRIVCPHLRCCHRYGRPSCACAQRPYCPRLHCPAGQRVCAPGGRHAGLVAGQSWQRWRPQGHDSRSAARSGRCMPRRACAAVPTGLPPATGLHPLEMLLERSCIAEVMCSRLIQPKFKALTTGNDMFPPHIACQRSADAHLYPNRRAQHDRS